MQLGSNTHKASDNARRMAGCQCFWMIVESRGKPGLAWRVCRREADQNCMPCYTSDWCTMVVRSQAPVQCLDYSLLILLWCCCWLPRLIWLCFINYICFYVNTKCRTFCASATLPLHSTDIHKNWQPAMFLTSQVILHSVDPYQIFSVDLHKDITFQQY